LGRIIDVVGVAGVAAVVALGFWLGCRPLQDRFDNFKRQVAADSKVLDAAAEIGARHEELAGQLTDSKTLFEQLVARIPHEPQEAKFLEQLSELARQSRLIVREFRPGVASRKGDYQEIEIRFSAEGSYEQICRFFGGINRLPRLCHVRDLTVSAADPQEDRYPIDIGLVIYFVPEEQTSPVEMKG
jgi:Tfp pilus assembly protein PilO